MKKSVKIAVTVVVGIILTISIALNITLGMECGLIKEPKSLSGSVNEAWCKTDAYIVHGVVDKGRYYSSYDGDYITNIDLEYRGNNTYEISYDQDFNTFNDLEVFFVISDKEGNCFPTSKEISDTPMGSDSIYFNSNISIPNIHIAEVWVRTID